MIPGVMALIPARFAAFFSIPILRRAAFHVRRLTSGMDVRSSSGSASCWVAS